MAKKKLNLTYISDGKARKTTFKHRKRGLMKKLDELKTLCDIDACAIIYNPFNSNPEVWPSNSEVNNIMQKFEMLTMTDQIFRSVNHEEYLLQQIAKVEKQNAKLIEDNNEKFMREVMFAFLGGNLGKFDMNNVDRHNLCEFIDQYLADIFHSTQQSPHFEVDESSSMAMERNIAPTAMVDVMAPTTMTEACSSSFLNTPIFNYPLPTNELQPIISSNEGPEHVSSLASNLLATSNQEVYIPVMTQDEVYYLNQNQNQQDGFVEQMMELSEQTSFPWMEENNHSNHP